MYFFHLNGEGLWGVGGPFPSLFLGGHFLKVFILVQFIQKMNFKMTKSPTFACLHVEVEDVFIS